jgi:hypothetical protein
MSGQSGVRTGDPRKEGWKMSEKTVPVERDHETARSDGLRLAGALWVMAGVVCAGLLIVVFVGERLLLQNPGLSALVLGGAIAALLTGGLLIARPGPGVVRWSTGVGVAWLATFGALTASALTGSDPDSGPSASLSLISGLGIAGAVVAFWSGRLARRLE